MRRTSINNEEDVSILSLIHNSDGVLSLELCTNLNNEESYLPIDALLSLL